MQRTTNSQILNGTHSGAQMLIDLPESGRGLLTYQEHGWLH